jgi:hypothetical protein
VTWQTLAGGSEVEDVAGGAGVPGVSRAPESNKIIILNTFVLC